jgi:hypothetical protein
LRIASPRCVAHIEVIAHEVEKRLVTHKVASPGDRKALAAELSLRVKLEP